MEARRRQPDRDAGRRLRVARQPETWVVDFDSDDRFIIVTEKGVDLE
jgi:hypothetical protein